MAKEKEKKPAAMKQDVMANRMLLLLAVCMFSVAVLFFLYNSFFRISTIPYMHGVQITLIVIDVLFIIASAVWFIRKRSQMVDETYKTVRSRSLLTSAIIIFPMVLAIYFYGVVAIRVLYILIPAYCVLYIIYTIYHRDFFWLCFLAFIFGAGFWGDYKFHSFTQYLNYVSPLLAIIIVIAVVAAIILFIVKKKDGTLKIGRKKIKVVAKNGAYAPLFILFALTLVCACIIYVNGLVAAYYSVFAMAAYVILSGIYYTIKLMLK